MSEENTPVTKEKASTGTITQGFSSTPSRRKLLMAISGGISSILAGCEGNQNSNPSTVVPSEGSTQSTNKTPTDNLSHVSGQDLRVPTRNNPSKTSFYGRALLNISAYHMRAVTAPSHTLQRVIWEPGVRAEGFGSGVTHYVWIKEPIEIAPNEITITIRDNAKWSDGHQITAKDIACLPLQQSISKYHPPYYTELGPDEPTSIFTAFDGFDITNQTITYRSSAGHFDSFWDHTIKNELGGYIGPRILPTHIEPYGTYADAVIETVTRAQAGEINPWKEYNSAYAEPDAPHKASLIDEFLNKVIFVDKFRKPTNVLATSAWNLVAMEGKEFIFEPNSYHRNAAGINFDRLRLEYTPSSKRERADLKADRFDFSATRGPSTPQAAVESFPDNIKQLLVPGIQFSGNELALNFDHPQLENRSVRAAIMYALDHQTIAKNIHQVATPPVETPGGDCWNATDFVSQAWIDENLTTYTTNRQKASNLMRDAGYTRNSGQWLDPDGEPFTLTLTTPQTTPRWEPTVASQLSDFGIQTSVRTLSGSVFSSRVNRGEFIMWPSVLKNSTNIAKYILRIWRFAAINPERVEIFPENQFKEGDFTRSGVPIPRTEERYRAFTIEAPPIGKHQGSLKEYHPAALSLLFKTNPPENEFRRRIKVGMWLANWYLPTIPLTKKSEQFFIDDAHWLWPTTTPIWNDFTSGGSILAGSVLSKGTIRANPDNPEKGTTVGDK